jgi:hypothetical protein
LANKPIITYQDGDNRKIANVRHLSSEREEIKYKFYKNAYNKNINLTNLIYENTSSRILSKGNSLQVSLKKDANYESIRNIPNNILLKH